MLYFQAIRFWLSRFAASLTWVPWLVGIALVAYLVRAGPVSTGIFTLGLAATALEVVVLFAFQVVHGFVRCGAKGAITGVGNALPREILRLVKLCERAAEGDHEAYRLAQELDDALAVLSSYDEGPDLVLYYKHLMVLEGHAEYAHQVNPTDRLAATQRAQLESQWQQFRRWWDSWPGSAA